MKSGDINLHHSCESDSDADSIIMGDYAGSADKDLRCLLGLCIYLAGLFFGSRVSISGGADCHGKFTPNVLFALLLT